MQTKSFDSVSLSYLMNPFLGTAEAASLGTEHSSAGIAFFLSAKPES